MEREPPSKKEQIKKLNLEFTQVSSDILRNIRNAGAHAASSDLRRIHPDIDWSNFPTQKELIEAADAEAERAIQGVREAIENRRRMHLLRHEKELDGN